MLLNTTKLGTVELELTLGEAFKLQAQLADVIRMLSMNHASGLQPSKQGTGQDHVAGCGLDLNTYVSQTGQHPNIPSGVTLVVTKPYTKA